MTKKKKQFGFGQVWNEHKFHEMEILSLFESNEDNLDLVQNQRDWSQYMHTEKDADK